MARVLLILALLFALITPGCAQFEPFSLLLGPSQLAAHHISFSNKFEEVRWCSSTAVGPHTLLTAAHCMFGTNVINVDGTSARVVNTLYDEQDHVILILEGITFPDIAKISTRLPILHEHIRICGWPGHSKIPVFREGTVSIADKEYQFVLPTFPGDSGAGMIADDGTLVAVLSSGNPSAESGAWRMAFTPEQLKAIR